jgi:CMP-N-acetylneuraminic acid synthetase
LVDFIEKTDLFIE